MTGLPTYPGTDREFRPGDRCRLVGLDSTHEITVESIILDEHGWTIIDTDGNDRPTTAHHLIGWKVTAHPADPPVEPVAELVAGACGPTNAQAAVAAAATILAAEAVAGHPPANETLWAEAVGRLARSILDRWPE